MAEDNKNPVVLQSAHRPPDFLLPKAGSAHPRGQQSKDGIYLSWGGQIYGPADAGQVLAGVRARWFEEDALFWFEGQDEWLPVGEFGQHADSVPAPAPHGEISGQVPAVNQPLRERAVPAESAPRKRRRHHRSGRGKKSHRGRRGMILVLAFVLVASGLTVAILLLISLA